MANKKKIYSTERPEGAVEAKLGPTDVNKGKLYVTVDGAVYGLNDKGYYPISVYLNKWKFKNRNYTCGPKNGYYKFHYNKKCYLLHIVLGHTFVDGYTDESNCLDHINGDSTDNRISNLRWCSKGMNIHYYWTEQASDQWKATFKKNASERMIKAHENNVYENHLNELHKNNKKNKENN